jgi:outer membrane protein assembly factor BamA
MFCRPNKFIFLIFVICISLELISAQTSPSEPPILVFEGNSRVSDQELLDNFVECSKGAWKTYDPQRYEYYRDVCIRRFLWSRGFLKAVVREDSLLFADNRYKVTFEVEEGPRFRWGEITFRDMKPEHAISLLNQFGQKKGDIADASRLQDFLYDKLHTLYSERGYLQYSAEMEPELLDPLDPSSDGTANVLVTIDTGSQLRVNRVVFTGTISPDEHKQLVDSFPLRKMDIFARSRLHAGIEMVNLLGKHEMVDIDAGVELRMDEESKSVDVIILLKPRKK